MYYYYNLKFEHLLPSHFKSVICQHKVFDNISICSFMSLHSRIRLVLDQGHLHHTEIQCRFNVRHDNQRFITKIFGTHFSIFFMWFLGYLYIKLCASKNRRQKMSSSSIYLQVSCHPRSDATHKSDVSSKSGVSSTRCNSPDPSSFRMQKYVQLGR